MTHAAPHVRTDAPATAVAARRVRPEALHHPLHSGVTIPRYHSMHFLGALFPLTAGLLLYGWRAGLAVAVVLAFAGATALVWRKVASLGRQLDVSHAFWMAMLLALMLP